MLTAADRAIWRQFLDGLWANTTALQDEDMLPVALVLARVRRRSDDAAEVGLGVSDLALLTREGVVGHDLVVLFEAAAVVAAKGDRDE